MVKWPYLNCNLNQWPVVSKRVSLASVHQCLGAFEWLTRTATSNSWRLLLLLLVAGRLSRRRDGIGGAWWARRIGGLHSFSPEISRMSQMNEIRARQIKGMRQSHAPETIRWFHLGKGKKQTRESHLLFSNNLKHFQEYFKPFECRHCLDPPTMRDNCRNARLLYYD